MFPEAPSGRSRGTGHKVKRGNTPSVRKHFLTTRVIEHPHRLPREVLESPSLGVLKSCVNTDLENQV